jgi:hypothetical protein
VEVGCVVAGAVVAGAVGVGLEVGVGAPADVVGVLPVPPDPWAGPVELLEGLELAVGPVVAPAEEAGAVGVGLGWELGCGVGEGAALGVLPPPAPVPLELGLGVPVPPDPWAGPVALLDGLTPAPELVALGVVLGVPGVVLAALGVALADVAGALGVAGAVEAGALDAGAVGTGVGVEMGPVAVASEVEETSCCQSRCQFVKSSWQLVPGTLSPVVASAGKGPQLP